MRDKTGTATLRKDGYCMRTTFWKDSAKYLHRVIWEENHGAIPKGMLIHHKDNNPENNDIDNLQLVTTQEHRRIHSPLHEIINGKWMKRCGMCGVLKDPDKDYGQRPMKSGGTRPLTYCRKCDCIRAKIIVQKRKERGDAL